MSADGLILEVNDTLLSWLARSREEVVGTALVRYLDAGSQVFYETRHTPILRLQGEVHEVSVTMTRADSSPMPVLLNSRVDETTDTVHAAVFDATARAEYERELLAARRAAEASEVRVRVLQASSNAFVSSTTEEEICQALVDAADEAFAPTAIGAFLLDDEGNYILTAGVHPLDGLLPKTSTRASDTAITEAKIITVFASDVDGQFSQLAQALRAGRLDSVSVIPMLRAGFPIGVLACFFARGREFDEAFADLQAALSGQAAQAIVRVRLQHELEVLALYDQLTGLANRKLILETVDRSIERAKTRNAPLAVVFLDLDGFKGINDQFGHATGDHVLRQVAERIRSGVRMNDAVGRYGGDEFVAVCDDADEGGAASVANRIREAVAQVLEGVPPGHLVTASVGVAVYTPTPGPPPTNDELLNLADAAMYLAKSAGKDRVSFLNR